MDLVVYPAQSAMTNFTVSAGNARLAANPAILAVRAARLAKVPTKGEQPARNAAKESAFFAGATIRLPARTSPSAI